MSGDQQPLDTSNSLHQQLDVSFALEAAGLGVWEYNPETGLVDWDRQARALFGIAEGNHMPYEQAIQYIHPDDVHRVDEAVRRALTPQSGGLYDQTYRTIGVDDKQVRWVRFVGRSEFTESGSLYRFAGIAQEVTQQIADKQKISSSEARFTDLVMATPAATAVFVGRDMLIQQVNAPMLAIWGKDASVIGNVLHSAIPELEGQPFLAQLQHVYDTGEPFRQAESKAELIENGQPKTVWFNHAYNPLYDESGTVYGVINTAVDVTAQVISRRQLEVSEARFRNLIAEAPVATSLFVGRQLRVEIANKSMLAIWGKGPDQLNRNLADILPEMTSQSFLAILDTVYTSGQAYSAKGARADLVVNGVPGTYYFDFTYKPLRDVNGEIFAIIDMATDVTQQVVAQQQIEQARQALQQAIDLAELGTWTVSTATGHTELSPRHADMFGLAATTMPYEQALAVVHPDDIKRVKAAFLVAMQPDSDGRYQAEYRIINARTGKQQVMRAVGRTSVDEQGNPVQIAGTTQDITIERESQQTLEKQVQERTQALLLANQDLKRSNDNLQTFAYVASHDLQEPLRKVQQFGDLLQSQYSTALGDGVAYLERMQLAASRMSTLIKDLLGFSRITTQRTTDEPVRLDTIVSDVLSVLDLAIAEANAQVQVDSLPTVSGDATQLEQLFQNLLSNALKFHRPGVPPHIRISSQPVLADQLPPSIRPAHQAPVYHRIDVADNGIGFDEKYLDRIFKVFQRLHGRSQFDGTGVGLAICEKVVVNHGGIITASSQPNQGATFLIYLPTL